MNDEDRAHFWSDEDVDRAIKQAIQETLAAHGRNGNPVVVERDGKVVWVKVEELNEKK